MKIKSILKNLGLFYVATYGVGAVLALITILIVPDLFVSGGVFAVHVILWNILFRKFMDERTVPVQASVILVIAVVLTVLMIVSKGNINGPLVLDYLWPAFPFVPYVFFMTLMWDQASLIVVVFSALILGLVTELVLRKGKEWKKALLFGLVFVLLLGTNIVLYVNREEARYGGHGFQYMNGYSSTDFTDYMVYAEESKLATLEKEASLRIEKEEEMPILDGAEACYPLYAAIAKAVYKDIDVIEKDYRAENGHYEEWRMVPNGKIVQFTNSVQGLSRLIQGECDLFFGARPAADQLDLAAKEGCELEVIPIGKEGFVFFVENDNPVSDLTADEIRKIYSGSIENWSDVGGKNQKIVAFQRPRYSGSQTMMEYFMGDTPLKAPKSYETFNSMEGVITNVAEYANEAGAMGYTFRYFLEGLMQEKGVKMLSVNGIAPTVENIRNSAYPLTTSLCLVVRKNDTNPNVRKMIDFILSDEGQELIEKTGYAPLATE